MRSRCTSSRPPGGKEGFYLTLFPDGARADGGVPAPAAARAARRSGGQAQVTDQQIWDVVAQDSDGAAVAEPLALSAAARAARRLRVVDSRAGARAGRAPTARLEPIEGEAPRRRARPSTVTIETNAIRRSPDPRPSFLAHPHPPTHVTRVDCPQPGAGLPRSGAHAPGKAGAPAGKRRAMSHQRHRRGRAREEGRLLRGAEPLADAEVAGGDARRNLRRHRDRRGLVIIALTRPPAAPVAVVAATLAPAPAQRPPRSPRRPQCRWRRPPKSPTPRPRRALRVITHTRGRRAITTGITRSRGAHGELGPGQDDPGQARQQPHQPQRQGRARQAARPLALSTLPNRRL